MVFSPFLLGKGAGGLGLFSEVTMHYVAKLDEAGAPTPPLYASHSHGFTRGMYAERATGSVHMGAGVCRLAPGGFIAPHLHSFEESFYVLEGELVALVGDEAIVLGPSTFGLIPTGTRHGFRNAGAAPARWVEMQAPQPRAPDYGRDTFFVPGEVPARLAEGTATTFPFGYFDEAQLPSPGGPSQMEGFNPTTGVAIKMFVDRSFGAIHQSLFLIQYQPGARIDLHDHTFEESYFIVRGRVRASADGQVCDLGPGDVIWTGVGCLHSFANLGDEPVRWIETQAPLPPSKEVFRFERDWTQYTS
jgi:mannose-6-phosphate isomerase-like protein (cupin superfamily)